MVFFRNQRLIVVPGAVTKFSTEEKITFADSMDLLRYPYICKPQI